MNKLLDFLIGCILVLALVFGCTLFAYLTIGLVKALA